MSLEENRQKIDDEYTHFDIKLKNSLALKKDSEIIAKLGGEFDDVCGCKFCVHGFPCNILKIYKIMKYLVVYLAIWSCLISKL